MLSKGGLDGDRGSRQERCLLEGHSGGRSSHLLFDCLDNVVKKHSTRAPYLVE